MRILIFNCSREEAGVLDISNIWKHTFQYVHLTKTKISLRICVIGLVFVFHIDELQADLNLRWTHKYEGTFVDVEAHDVTLCKIQY